MSIPALVEKRIREIGEDKISGSAELVEKGADVFRALVEAAEAESVPEFLRDCVAVCVALIRAQPSMAPFFSLAGAILGDLEAEDDLETLKARVLNSARRFAASLNQHKKRIGRYVAPLVRDNSTILTNSYSSTVMESLIATKSTGKRFSVICPESRPMREGELFATQISDAGIPATLIVDSAVGSFLEDVQLVLVGGDSLSSRGLVSKIGTCGMAICAVHKRIPMYALCGSEKFLPESLLPYFRIEERDPDEVSKCKAPHLQVVNRYFDTTPLRYISGVVTEDGVLSGDALDERLKGLRAHSVLLRALREGIK
ncbi:MAG: translation initiation factor eIF-2B [bacterium]